MIPFSIVVAFSKPLRGIGCNNKITWNIPLDTKRFKQITTTTSRYDIKNVVIMGRKTFESLPTKPLSGRLNIIISQSKEIQDIWNCNPDILFASSLQNAFSLVGELKNIDHTFIIGGESIYKQAILLPNCEKIYTTVIEMNQMNEFDTIFKFKKPPVETHYDTFFPHIPDCFEYTRVSEVFYENEYKFRFFDYTRKKIKTII